MADNAEGSTRSNISFPARGRAAFHHKPDADFDSVKLRLDREQPLTVLEFTHDRCKPTDF